MKDVARTLREAGAAGTVLINGSALSEEGMVLAGKVAAATGARVFSDTFVTRMARGAGRVNVPRVPCLGEQALELLQGTRHLVTVGTRAPVSSFVYPGMPGELTPAGCTAHALAEPAEDGVAALAALVEALDATSTIPATESLVRPPLPTGPLNQVLWTQAREELDVTAVIFSNRRYAILEMEYGLVGAGDPSAARVACSTSPARTWMGRTRSIDGRRRRPGDDCRGVRPWARGRAR